MMTSRVDEAFDRTGAKDRRVVSTARPEADPALLDRQILDAGKRAPCGVEEGELAAGGDVRVEAFLLHGRTDEQASIAARHEIDIRCPDDMAEQRLARIHLQREHLAL